MGTSRLPGNASGGYGSEEISDWERERSMSLGEGVTLGVFPPKNDLDRRGAKTIAADKHKMPVLSRGGLEVMRSKSPAGKNTRD